jgi:hypothetical protein
MRRQAKMHNNELTNAESQVLKSNFDLAKT